MLAEIRAAAPRPASRSPAACAASAMPRTYLALADRIVGPDWMSPKTFRLGASSLFETLMQARDL